jgi:bifunctional ADP-heptose synthase (sugar kinase/adenylyltransferase)
LNNTYNANGTLEQPKQENINQLNESTNSNIATDPRPQDESNYDRLTTSENKRIPVPEHVEPEPKKRGFLSRFFLPYG